MLFGGYSPENQADWIHQYAMWQVSHLSGHDNRKFGKNRRAKKQYGMLALMLMQDMWPQTTDRAEGFHSINCSSSPTIISTGVA